MDLKYFRSWLSYSHFSKSPRGLIPWRVSIPGKSTPIFSSSFFLTLNLNISAELTIIVNILTRWSLWSRGDSIDKNTRCKKSRWTVPLSKKICNFPGDNGHHQVDEADEQQQPMHQPLHNTKTINRLITSRGAKSCRLL